MRIPTSFHRQAEILYSVVLFVLTKVNNDAKLRDNFLVSDGKAAVEKLWVSSGEEIVMLAVLFGQGEVLIIVIVAVAVVAFILLRQRKR